MSVKLGGGTYKNERNIEVTNDVGFLFDQKSLDYIVFSGDRSPVNENNFHYIEKVSFISQGYNTYDMARFVEKIATNLQSGHNIKELTIEKGLPKYEPTRLLCKEEVNAIKAAIKQIPDNIQVKLGSEFKESLGKDNVALIEKEIMERSKITKHFGGAIKPENLKPGVRVGAQAKL